MEAGVSGSDRGVVMIDNIGLRILTSRSFSRDNDNTTDSGGTGGRNDTGTLCLLNYVGVDDTEYGIYLFIFTVIC